MQYRPCNPDDGSGNAPATTPSLGTGVVGRRASGCSGMHVGRDESVMRNKRAAPSRGSRDASMPRHRQCAAGPDRRIPESDRDARSENRGPTRSRSSRAHRGDDLSGCRSERLSPPVSIGASAPRPTDRHRRRRTGLVRGGTDRAASRTRSRRVLRDPEGRVDPDVTTYGTLPALSVRPRASLGRGGRRDAARSSPVRPASVSSRVTEASRARDVATFARVEARWSVRVFVSTYQFRDSPHRAGG